MAAWAAGSASTANTVAAGLAIDARHAELHWLQGILALEADNLDAARAALDAAVEAEPTLVAAWANRAVVAFEAGDAESAVADLNAAIALEDRPDLRLNRALVLETLERHRDAITDYDAAAGDEGLGVDARAGRQRCLAALAA